MKENRVKIFFEDMSFHTSYSLLEMGKDDEELKKIAKQHGIVMPSRDIAIFKGRYAMVDKENKNKCTLPKKEVEEALNTLNHKAVDKDHLRASVVGHWLNAELDGDEIITYATFFKSNFPEDYDTFKEKMATGKMKISFEAWGDREFKENGSYELKNIEFAGGALLFDTEPAFPEAEVLEMSNKVLEFAKIMDETKPNSQEGEEKKTDTGIMEDAKLNFYYDTNTIARLMYEGKCPSCDMQGWFDVNSINFDEDELMLTCGSCGAKSKMKLTPQMTLIKKGKKIEKSSNKKEDKIDNATEPKNQKGGDKVMDELLKKYSKSTVEELVAFLDKEIDTVKASLTAKDSEIATIKTELETAKKEVTTITASAKEVKDALDKRIADEKSAIVKARREEIGETAKDMKDEDLLDDVKFENIKLKKENAALKEVKKPAQGGLEAGADLTADSPTMIKQRNIQSKAFPEKKS